MILPPVISWLNKQMNEQVMGVGGGRGQRLPFSTDTLSTIRPSPPLPRPPLLTSTSLPYHQQVSKLLSPSCVNSKPTAVDCLSEVPVGTFIQFTTWQSTARHHRSINSRNS